MKIATWNINSINSRLGHVLGWCEKNRPDVLCLQETKVIDEKFPYRSIRSIGYDHIAAHGEMTYNGVAIISRLPMTEVRRDLPDDDKEAPKRLIEATVGGIRIVNVYAPHGTRQGTPKFKFKLDWIARLRRYFDENFTLDENVVLCGDLNVAPHELDVWKPSLWKDKLHFSKPERDAIRDLKQWGFVDVFRQINDDEKEFSWWDYFHRSFEKDRGLRIDHIWTSAALAELCTDCWIDKEPRALDKPSDHAPVVAQFTTPISR